MNKLYYIPFFLFLIGAYYFYNNRAKKQTQFYKEKRDLYIKEHPDLTVEQSENLQKNIPWSGMDSATLTGLFGEPGRKRVLEQSLTKFIWSYPDLFVYIHKGTVVEWKQK